MRSVIRSLFSRSAPARQPDWNQLLNEWGVLGYDQELARTLLHEPAGAQLSAYDVGGKAHNRSSRGLHLEAATLFCVAAERAAREHAAAPDSPDQTMNHVLRAAMALVGAGQLATALPMLRAATRFDWAAAGIPNDAHTTEWAYVELLAVAAQEGEAAFDQLFDEAIARCHALGMHFPFIHPKQERLLQLCLERNWLTHVPRIVAAIRARRPISREARELLRRADEALSQPAG